MDASNVIQLQQEMTVLRRLFEPWNTGWGDTVIWEPEASDLNAQFKRDMIGKARDVIAAGESALAGTSFKVPEFAESEFDAIEESLGDDHEQRNFYELAVACGRVVQSLGRLLPNNLSR